jgi:hypothetical protein
MSQTDTTQEAHVSIREGDTFRDELNNEAVEVLNIEGDVATVRSGGAEWRERVRGLREKVVAGDYTPTGDSINISVDSKATPEGVPEDYNYIAPDEEPPEDHDVVESDRGGTYVSPEPTDGGGAEADEGTAPEQADEMVRETIADVEVDAVDDELGERAMEKYAEHALTSANNIKDAQVAQETFDNIGDLFVNEFRTGINFSAGRNKEQASFEVEAARRESTFHHEFGHAIADAHGFGVSADAAREGDVRYNPNEENFVEIDLDRDDISEFKLTQLEDEDAPEEVEQLIDATNQAWERMQETAAENPGQLDDVVVRDNYGSISAHETLAQMHETMQTDRLPTTGHANFFDEHPELTRSYVEVVEPAPRMKDLLSHLHKDRGEENSPFDEDPYPGREV